MSIPEIATRYARAIFNLATSEEDLKSHLHALESFVDILKKRSEIFQFFSSPHINKHLKESVLEKSLGAQIDPLLMQSLAILLEKGQFKYLPEIVIKYHQLVVEKLEIMEALLVTATPLEAITRDAITKKLQNFYQKKIVIDEKIDPQLIGGGFLMARNKLLDFSIKGKMKNLKDYLQNRGRYEIAT